MRVVRKGVVSSNQVYVGRPSVLGNPFVLGKDGDRETVVRKYKSWLEEQWATNKEVQKELVRLARKEKAGEELDLVCWCAAKPRRPYALSAEKLPVDACHADVIAAAVLEIVSRIK